MRKYFAVLAGLALGAGVAAIPHEASASPTAAIEYYDAGLNHYFITAAPDEILALNSGRFFGWVPTGLNIPVLSADATNPGSTPVCRFYGNPDAVPSLDSHFYSADPIECAQVLQKFPGIWLLESWNVFRAYLPDAASGVCPTGTKPVYRLWNHRSDVNHRYTDRIDIALAMENIGYIAEGYGLSEPPTAFCAPSSNDTTMSCSAGATNSTPVVGSSVTLTAACSGNPTQYTWIGCTSATNTCVATSRAPGAKSYVVTASNSAARSAPSTVSVVWQMEGDPGTVACSLATSNTTPVVGSSITLTAACTGNPTSYSWIGCTSSANTCIAASTTAGSKPYSVAASNAGSTSAPAAISVNWLTAPPPPTSVSCALATSNSTPVVGSSITLTGACTGNPTSYSWVGCTSATSTCVATSTVPGSRTYSISASNGDSTSSPTAIAVDWQPANPPPSAVSCTLTSNNTLPTVGSSITLSAACTGGPTSYAWVGCTSSGSTCTATSTTTGTRSYSVSASKGSTTSPAVAVSVSWLSATPPPPGMATSADFVNRTSDPRGGNSAYNSFRRLPDGRGIVFGGFGAVTAGNNAVAIYSPVANTWETALPNTPWVYGPVLPDGSQDARGRTYLGNRDNHGAIISPTRNEAWFFRGQRTGLITGNETGQFNYVTKTWSHIDDSQVSFSPVEGWSYFSNPYDGATAWIQEIDTGVIYTSQSGWSDGALTIIRPNPGHAQPYKATVYWSINGPTFPGQVYLRYTSGSGFARRGEFYVYGGADVINSSQSRLLYKINVDAAPVMSVIATNTLPDGQRVDGEAVLADWDPVKDQMIVTNGKVVNVYDFASQAWVYVPVNTPPDPNRESPTNQGAGLQGFYSPEVGQYIILGLNSRVYGLRLNYGAPPPPSASPTITGFTATPATVLVGAPSVLNATVANATALTLDGVAATLPVTVTPVATHTYILVATGAAGTTPASATATVTVTGSPPPPPPPPPGTPAAPSAGSLTVTAVAVPYVGSSGVLGHAKNLDFARLGNRWYKMTGDHTAIDPNGPSDQGGRQEILSFNAAANDWRMDQPYYIIDRNQLQFAFPDDTFAVPVENEIWVFPGPTNHTLDPNAFVPGSGHLWNWQVDTPSGRSATQIYGAIMAWNATTKLWRIVNQAAWPTGQPWRGVYDPVKKRVIVPGSTGDGMVFFVYDAVTGNDITPKVGASYIGNRVIPGGVHVAGMAVDWPNRTAYLVDIYDAKLYSINLDTFDVDFNARLVVDAWPETKQTGNQGAIKITWDPDVRAVVYAGSKLVAYQPDTNRITIWPRPDGYVNSAGNYVPTSTLFYDPDTRDVISIGTMNWDTGPSLGVYWRLTIH